MIINLFDLINKKTANSGVALRGVGGWGGGVD